jgi:Fic family protein
VETPFRIEPTALESPGELISDVVAEIAAASAALGTRLAPRTAASLAALVRVMNCYYSNLIEGHNTRLRDIERALAEDLDADDHQRALQLEARAHIRVQEQIDKLHGEGKLPEPASVEFIRWIHREFYRDAAENMLRIGDGDRAYQMTPGSFRSRPEEDNVVGLHQPPSSSYVTKFMDYFEEKYRFERMGLSKKIISMALAHHRLNYVHPFPDGNGRVSRLMSHAMGLAAGIGAHGLWSVSRGLARGLGDRGQYKRMMNHADTRRLSDTDGRGNLSEQITREFVLWFLQVALDQIKYMSSLFALDTLSQRLEAYVAAKGFADGASGILKEVLTHGEMVRGEAKRVTGMKDRTARKALAALVEDGILESDTAKGPVHLKFDASSADQLFPNLFPANA